MYRVFMKSLYNFFPKFRRTKYEGRYVVSTRGTLRARDFNYDQFRFSKRSIRNDRRSLVEK
jgi:hypothetical protein